MSISLCACTLDQINERRGCLNPVVSFEGAVLDTYEVNGYDDSDFFAVIWDGEKVTTKEYASTRGWTYHNGASVDATDEVVAAATEWYRARWEAGEIRRQEELAVSVGYGATVRSLTTRGKNVGVQGVVKWVGEKAYSPYSRCETPGEQRFGVQVPGERGYRFLPANRLEVVDPPTVDVEDIKLRARTVAPHNWRSALYVGVSDRALAFL